MKLGFARICATPGIHFLVFWSAIEKEQPENGNDNWTIEQVRSVYFLGEIMDQYENTFVRYIADF